MSAYILQNWKKKKVIVFLILFGFFIANIVLSVGTGFVIENYRYITDLNSGDPKKQLDISLRWREGTSLELVEAAVKQIAAYGEIQIVSLSTEKTEIGDVLPVAVDSEKTKGWHIPIVAGTYLNSVQKEIVIGQEIAERESLHPGDFIQIFGARYQIIGIAGRKGQETTWDETVYIDVRDYFEYTKKQPDILLQERCMGVVLKNGKEQMKNDFSSLESTFEQMGIEITYETLSESVSTEALGNSLTITFVSSGMIFLIAGVNIINLMTYWMLERRRDLAVMKALGCTNKYLQRVVLLENSAMALIGAVTALVVQMLLNGAFGTVFQKEGICLKIEIWNMMLTVLASSVCGVLTAWLVSKRTLDFDPVEVLANE